MNFSRRELFHYEAPEDGGGEYEEPIGDVDDGGDGGGSEEEAAAWALSQGDWEQTVNYLQQTAPILQQLQESLPYLQQMQQYNQQPQGFDQQQGQDIDPFDPSSVQGYIQRQIQEGMQQALAQQLGPYQPMLNSFANEQGEQLARQELATIKTTVGDFDQDTAFLIAAGSIEQGNDPSVALRQAAQFSHDYEKKIRSDEREKYKSELQNLRDAPRETPVGSASGREVQPVPTGPRRYQEVVERVLARQNSSTPGG
jgi:hypothetical protein